MLRRQDMGDSVKGLLKSLNRAATEDELALFDTLTVAEMTLLFDMLGQEKDPESIVAAVRKRREKRLRDAETPQQREVRERREAEIAAAEVAERAAKEVQATFEAEEERPARVAIEAAERRSWAAIEAELDEVIEVEGVYRGQIAAEQRRCAEALAALIREEVEGETALRSDEAAAWEALAASRVEIESSTAFAKCVVETTTCTSDTLLLAIHHRSWWRLIEELQSSSSCDVTIVLCLPPESAARSFTLELLVTQLLSVFSTDYRAWMLLQRLLASRDESIGVVVRGESLAVNSFACSVRVVECLAAAVEGSLLGLRNERRLLSKSILDIALTLTSATETVAICGLEYTKRELLILSIEREWGNLAAWYALLLLAEGRHEVFIICGSRFTVVDICILLLTAGYELYGTSAVVWKKMAEHMDHTCAIVTINEQSYSAVCAFVRAAELCEEYCIDLALHIAQGSVVRISGVDVTQKECLKRGLVEWLKHSRSLTAGSSRVDQFASREDAWSMLAVMMSDQPDEHFAAVEDSQTVIITAEYAAKRGGAMFEEFWFTTDIHLARMHFSARIDAIVHMREVRRILSNDEEIEAQELCTSIAELHRLARAHFQERTALCNAALSERWAEMQREREGWSAQVFGTYRKVTTEYNARIVMAFKPRFLSLTTIEESESRLELEQRLVALHQLQGAHRLHRIEVVACAQDTERLTLASLEACHRALVAERDAVRDEERAAREAILSGDLGAGYNAILHDFMRARFKFMMDEEGRARNRIVANVRIPHENILKEEKSAHAEVLVWLLRMGNVREDVYGNKYPLLRTGAVKAAIAFDAFKPPAVGYLLQHFPSVWRPVYNAALSARIIEFEHIPSATRHPDILVALGLPPTLELNQCEGDVIGTLLAQGIWQEARDAAGAVYHWNVATQNATYDLATAWLAPLLPRADATEEEQAEELERQSSLRQVASFAVQSRRKGRIFVVVTADGGDACGSVQYRDVATGELVDSIPSGAVVYVEQVSDEGTYFFNTSTRSAHWELPSSPEPSVHVDPVVASCIVDDEAALLNEFVADDAVVAAVESAASAARARPATVFVQYIDGESRVPYYLNFYSGETVWERPSGNDVKIYVQAETDDSETYFVNAVTQSTHWDL